VRRPTLEHEVRRRVAALPAVRLLGRHDVVGLVIDRPGQEVVGVRVIGRDDGSAEQELCSDLVVVATGRGSRLPVWLEQLGYPRPPRRQVAVGVGYASREVRLAPGALGDDVVALSGPTPARPRGGGLSLVEGGRCLVTLMGMLGDHPPTDPVAFTRWAGDLALEDIGLALDDAEPLADPVAHRHPTSVWHRYDATAMPSGLVVVGDAVCALNPIYGQGMTVAALQAKELGNQLAAGPFRPSRFQRRAARLAGVAWALSTGGDLAFPEVEGPRTPATWALGHYVGLVQAGAARDPALGQAFLRVTSMVDPPSALFRPAALVRAARHLGPVLGAPTTAPQATVP
jgi:2-polyprenyl-6-methoxyphenol hydroxylase-like FAD-dependent oxidoreductase